MAHRTLGPLIFIVAFVVLGALGNRLQSYALPDYVHCAYDLAHVNRPAADVLIVGNSRSGRAIDAAYVERNLREKINRAITVERMSVTRADIAQFNILSRHYTRTRGFPKYVILQLMYNRFPDEQNQIGLPIHKSGSIAYGNIDDLRELQNSQYLNEEGALLPSQIKKGYRVFLAVMVEKVIAQVYAGLYYPSRLLLGKVDFPRCTEDMRRRQSDAWLYGNIPDVVPIEAPSNEVAGSESWRKASGKYLQIDPNAEFRAFENDQMHRLIELFEEGGSEVILTIFPHVSEPMDANIRSEIANEFPDQKFIDIVTPFQEEVGDQEIKYYLDIEHVNVFGAAVLSRHLTEHLSRTVR